MGQVVSAAAAGSGASISTPHSGAVRYHQLYVGPDGYTKIARDLAVSNMEKQDFTSSSSLQYVRSFSSDDFEVVNTILTQQFGENPWHYCPAPQFVVTLAGRWFVRTPDGNEIVMGPGDLLYQDNTKEHPKAVEGTRQCMHYSGAVDGPCNQLIIQLKTALQTDNPGRWSE
jgi:hypothetical protein